MRRTPKEIEAIDGLIQDCTIRADANRRVAHAFRSRIISKGPALPDGSLNPETIKAMELHTSWAVEDEKLRDELYELREGHIDYLS